ncbi:MAG TPA: N-acetylmuramoyl-L-alanine amidase, partial [bacterium]|nr:N-acetylmuramoyl-L-alanine amidase [bacterium]
KDINLAIAQKLRKKLVDLGYDAVLTRKDDTFLELEERTGIANKDGDLFISVHCNSTDKKGDKNASGIEVYYADVASDKGSARLAAIENQTSPKHMSELETILEGLARNEFTVKSAELATAVQKRLVDDVKKPYPDLKTHANGVKSALFYVCLTAHMPAILVETSFISNPKEEKRLADPRYQQVIADSIAGAADAWLDGQAMSGAKRTLVAAPEKEKDPPSTPAPTPTPGGSGEGKESHKHRAEKRH